MSAPRTTAALVLSGAVIAVVAPASAQPADLVPTRVDVGAPVRAVTAYPGRASVTRTVRHDVTPGLYELHFIGLPETVQPESIQARVDGAARVLAVDYVERSAREAASPRIAAFDARIAEHERNLAEALDERGLVESQERFLDGLGVRAAADATGRGGTADLDLAVVREQLAFLTTERTRLLTERRTIDVRVREHEEALDHLRKDRGALAGDEQTARSAVVSLAALASGPIIVDLVYLVTGSTWAPRYNIRADADGSGVAIEYDAHLEQRTGEDWTDVELILSTAQPTVAANPPVLTPWFLDERGRGAPAAAAPRRRGVAERDRAVTGGARLEDLAADAAVGGGGPSVTYTLPRRVTVLSSARKQQRTRIASTTTHADFVYVAMPLLTGSVYVRAELVNTSAYQFLPGPAAIFVGTDYVGPTHMDAVSPNAPFNVYMGIDRTVVARRQTITRKTAKTGLLGGGRRISYSFRIEVDNGAGKPIRLELWDRQPVSRTDRIEVSLGDLSHALARDVEYVEEQAPLGLLKWLLDIPAGAIGPSAYPLTYSLTVVHPKEMQMTPLPE